ncbi:hemophore-related protein [Mycolicibacterium sp. J2]|jgi:hemophore-related protein|uniref:hemophore-related protein n=1 Tax=Mycolicibacterium sp. J2 TaxID=2993511 RepID=UPI00224AEFE1|nr:hemophore-related protein [Mycolicibacterium sp. J2]MCX2714253.1 hemophore-related protein [Mycolicibacterium sp. J2]
MVKVSGKKFVLALVGAAAVLPLSAGIASATPDLAPVVNTTCTYDQVIGAMNAERPDLAAEFNAQPVGQAMLRNFLASGPAERQRTATQIANAPGASKYFDGIAQIITTCNNY